MEKKKEDSHYVDKDILYQAYVDWYAAIEAAEKNGKDRPQPPKYLQESVIKICNKYASRFNFYNYSFKEEMIGDAIENIVRYLDRFDVVKYKNPFGYLSMIAERAFIRRIYRERKQAYVKHLLISNSDVLTNVSTQQHDDEEYKMAFMETLQANLKPELEEQFKAQITRKPGPVKKKADKNDVEMFFDSEMSDE